MPNKEVAFMNLQYITDSNGQTTGVVIPIEEWNELKTKYQDIDGGNIKVPEWHKGIVQERMENYRKNPNQDMDFDAAIRDIERDL
jgi:hypothetical protein